MPFGNVPDVLNWLELYGEVRRPANEHPARPVLGFSIDKEEQSGKRVWQLIRAVYGDSPDSFFSRCGLLNLCPLAFFDATGRNVTPDAFGKEFIAICRRHCQRIIQLLNPSTIVCFGRFVEKCLKEVAGREIIYFPHPSPRSVNNHNWVEDTIRLIVDKHPSLLPEDGGSRGRSANGARSE